MPISGYVAGGAGEALEQVLDRRLKEQIRQQQEKEHADQVAIQRQQIALQQRTADEMSKEREANMRFRQEDRDTKLGNAIAEQIGFGDITPEQGAQVSKSPEQAARVRKFDRPIIDARPIAGTTPLDASGPQSRPVVRLEPTAAQQKQQTLEDERARILAKLPKAVTGAQRRNLYGEATAAGVKDLPNDLFDATDEEKAAAAAKILAEQRAYSERQSQLNFDRQQGAENARATRTAGQPDVFIEKGGEQRLVSNTEAARLINNEGWKRATAKDETAGRPLPTTTARDIGSMNSALEMATALKKMKPGDTGAMASLEAKYPNFVTEVTGWGAEAKGRASLVGMVGQVLAKAMEGARLTDADRAYYNDKIVVKMSDPDDVVRGKLEALEQFVRSRRDKDVQAQKDAGFDMSRFEARIAGEAQGAKGDDGQYHVMVGTRDVAFPTKAAADKFKADVAAARKPKAK